MKLSIVIITKNEEKYLPKLLESIQKQKLNFGYEIIVSDANSVDKTRQIAKSFWCKIVDGWLPSKWRNEGEKVANWEWILFLDSDVVIPDNVLQVWMNKVLNKKVIMGTPYVTWIKEEKDYIWSMLWRSSFLFFNLFKDVWFGPSILVKKDAFLKVGWFDEKLYLAEDIDFIKKINKIWKGINLYPAIQVSTRRLKKDWYTNVIINYIKWTLQYLFLKKKFEKSKYEKKYKL